MSEKELFTVLFMDNHVLVIVKPPGIPVQEEISGRVDLLTALKDYLKELLEKPGNVFLGLVHRLDQPVSGVMVFARTSKAAGRLSEAFNNRTVDKKYLAVVHGKTPESGVCEDYLLKDSAQNRVSVVQESVSGAQFASLTYKRVAFHADPDFSLLEINLGTGRPHQIRVQFASRKFPVAGDKRYGFPDPVKNIALLAHTLSFPHPVSKELLSFSAPVPGAFPWSLFSKTDFANA